MNLGELKSVTAKLLEEYRQESRHFVEDDDVSQKLIHAVNVIVSEVAKIVAIKAKYEFFQSEITPHKLPKDCHLVTNVMANGKSLPFYSVDFGEITVLTKNANITVHYDAIPTQYLDDSKDEEPLPFAENVNIILPYGIAKMLLLGVGEGNAASEYESKYYNYLQELKPTAGKVKVKVQNMFQRRE